MTQISFKSAGVSARTINLTGPTAIQPSGIPAGVIGTSIAGPAYVPTTVATYNDFQATFGETTNDIYVGPLAVSEWLRNAQAATFIRVLGAGAGNARTVDTDAAGGNRGKVEGAGYVVGGELPEYWNGFAGELTASQYATFGNSLGRTYFLGAFMSQYETTASNTIVSSSMLTDAGLSANGAPIVRGILFAASGTLLTLSSSISSSNVVSTGTTTPGGAVTGSVKLLNGLQEFVMLVNGLTNTDPMYPSVITASFDVEAPNYFGSLMNRDPLKLEQAGYYLQTDWVIHPSQAVVTGSGIILNTDNGVKNLRTTFGLENVAFLVTGSKTRNSGSLYAPNYENFEDRYRTPKSPWLTSQKFGGKPVNLFRIHSVDDGVYANDKVKISIENITPSLSDVYLYGTFDLLVRDFSDSDKSKIVLEQYRGLSLDPTNPNYIARVIGDYNTFYNFDTEDGASKLVTLGDYTNNSKYIRVEVASGVDAQDVDPTALPVGFRGPAHLVTSGSVPLAGFNDATTYAVTNPFRKTVQMPIPFRDNLVRGIAPNTTSDKGLYWGVQFERKISAIEPNKTTIPETSIRSFASYFPNFQTDYQNFVVMDNEGAIDTVENGIVDADRFNNNGFSLENIQIKYRVIPGSTATFPNNTIPDTTQAVSWNYVRNGQVTTNTGSLVRRLSVADLADPATRQLGKFNLYLQGGFDGVNIFNYDERYLTNKAINEELDFANRGEQNGSAVVAYNTALNLIADATEVDVQLFVIPGIRNPSITDKAIETAENRFDALYIMDIETYDTDGILVASEDQVPSVRYTINNFRDRNINTSFGATYFPDVIMRDTVANTLRQVPPSVAVLGAFSYNDAVAFPWFAPAGFARGGLATTERSTIELSRTNMDDLYEVDINPIVSFAGSEGLVIWGQKTMYAQQSALDRVNVRRLLLSIRRQVRQVSNRILFEQTLPETLTRFSQLVNPILKRVQEQKGVDRFLVRIDTSTTTQADFENKTIRGKIFLQPTRTLEFLSVDFVINNPTNFGQG
jgi:hypothetical protein